MLDPLAARYKLVQYDARGTGSSTRGIGPDHSMVHTLIDLEAVADALGLSRLILHADNFSCYTAMRFSAKYPDRVKALILVNPTPLRGQPLMHLWRDFYLNSWPTFIETFISTGTPGGDPMRELVANGVTQEDFINLANGGIGHFIADVIPSVTVPTLVLASRSYLNPEYMAASGEVATGVRNARLIHFDGTKNADFMMSLDGSLPNGIRVINEFLDELGLGEAEPFATSAIPAETSLSSREVEVLRLVASGKRNREIARDLVISGSTVAKHVSSILAKTESSNRAEATTFAHTHRLV
jgi:DNA-binding CsgD family transcriptional regulator